MKLFNKKAIRAVRLNQNPIITPDLSETLGANINGPSLIRVPDWTPEALGKYYLYFAHHHGKYIRLAYSDFLEGPWQIYEPGTLKLEETICSTHIASPDIYIDENKNTIRMYFHGSLAGRQHQASFVAISNNGVNFEAYPEILGNSYFRIFLWDDYYYAMARSGQLYRSRDGIKNFEPGANPFNKLFYRSRVRHVAVYVSGTVLNVYYSRIGDKPECILLSTINLDVDWLKWKASRPIIILTPEMDYEGAELPLIPSINGIARHPVRQLRDPAIYFDNSKLYLLYTIAGEAGIAIAELINRNC